MPSRIRILVADDYLPFREYICSVLETRTDLMVLAEVSDGLEAVQKAQELQPDLILLDIGLPKLNGIQAARRILKVAPKSKIIFVSQETSVDVVSATMRLGALGYVEKAKARTDLLKSIDAVLQGKQFLSDGLSATEAPKPVD